MTMTDAAAADRIRAILAECNPITKTRAHLRMEGNSLDLAILNALATAAGDTFPMMPKPGQIRWYVHRETINRMAGWIVELRRIPRLDQQALARTLYIHHRQEMDKYRKQFRHSTPREWCRAAALDTFGRVLKALPPSKIVLDTPNNTPHS